MERKLAAETAAYLGDAAGYGPTRGATARGNFSYYYLVYYYYYYYYYY